MNNADKEYLKLAQRILDNGAQKGDRTGTGTLSVFGYQMRFDLQEGFPLLTTKHVPFRLVAEELLWFVSGSTDIRDLTSKNIHIWTPDAVRWHNEYRHKKLTKEGYLEFLELTPFTEPNDLADLGPIYGAQWRSWPSHYDDTVIDQLADVIEEIKNNPNSRRLLVSAWNPAQIDDMCLPPCHYAFQFYVADGKLNCMFNMRSTDSFLGLPFNIASYALLTHMVAHVCELEVGELIYTGADVHIYLNHIEQVKEQLTREPRALPTLEVNRKITSIDDFTINDLTLHNYNPHPVIKGDVSVG